LSSNHTNRPGKRRQGQPAPAAQAHTGAGGYRMLGAI